MSRTFNSRVFPGINPMLCSQNDRVRIRFGNLTMTNHPIHFHGHEFTVTGTDGGWVPPSARWPEVTTDVAVGQMRAIEFDATEEGDWAFHCHKSHHTMNAMGHGVPTMIGIDQSETAKKINKLIPDYMVMGDRGGAMGGMFTTVKIRKGLARNDYKDPGWFKHPPGTVAREWTGPVPAPVQAKGVAVEAKEKTLNVIKSGDGHHRH